MRRLGHEGAALFVTFLFMVLLTGVAAAVAILSRNGLVIAQSGLMDRQAFDVAEAGLQRARAELNAGTWSASTCTSGSPCTGQVPTSGSAIGEYRVTITGSGPYTITSEGYVPTYALSTARRQVSASNITSSSNLCLDPDVVGLASSSDGSHTPDRAKDGDLNTKWQASTKGAGSWLAMDFQAATSLNQVVIREDANITSLTIEWSDDSASWTTASGLSITTTGSGDSEVYTATFTSTSHRYFRAYFSGVTSNKKAAVKEMETSSTGTSYFTNGTFTTQW